MVNINHLSSVKAPRGAQKRGGRIVRPRGVHHADSILYVEQREGGPRDPINQPRLRDSQHCTQNQHGVGLSCLGSGFFFFLLLFFERDMVGFWGSYPSGVSSLYGSTVFSGLKRVL